MNTSPLDAYSWGGGAGGDTTVGCKQIRENLRWSIKPVRLCKRHGAAKGVSSMTTQRDAVEARCEMEKRAFQYQETSLASEGAREPLLQNTSQTDAKDAHRNEEEKISQSIKEKHDRQGSQDGVFANRQ